MTEEEEQKLERKKRFESETGLAAPDFEETFSASLMRVAKKLDKEPQLVNTVQEAARGVFYHVMVQTFLKTRKLAHPDSMPCQVAGGVVAFSWYLGTEITVELKNEGYEYDCAEDIRGLSRILFCAYSDEERTRIAGHAVAFIKEWPEARRAEEKFRKFLDGIAWLVNMFCRTGDDGYLAFLAKQLEALCDLIAKA